MTHFLSLWTEVIIHYHAFTDEAFESSYDAA